MIENPALAITLWRTAESVLVLALYLPTLLAAVALGTGKQIILPFTPRNTVEIELAVCTMLAASIGAHFAFRRWISPLCRAFFWHEVLGQMRHAVVSRLYSRHVRLHSWIAGTPGVVGLAPGRLVLSDASTRYQPVALSAKDVHDLRLLAAPVSSKLYLIYRGPCAASSHQTVLVFQAETDAVLWLQSIAALLGGTWADKTA